MFVFEGAAYFKIYCGYNMWETKSCNLQRGPIPSAASNYNFTKHKGNFHKKGKALSKINVPGRVFMLNVTDIGADPMVSRELLLKDKM